MKQANKVQTIAEILNRPLITRDGKKIGRVIDLEVAPESGFTIVSLLIGRYGLLHRLHVLHPFANSLGVRPEVDTIRWKDVERVEQGKIILRISHDDYKRTKEQPSGEAQREERGPG